MSSLIRASGDPSDIGHLWAVLDLGSNSFHLLLVKLTRDGFVLQERLKEKVQLLAGFEEQKISESAQERGLACLRRFAQRLKPVSSAHTRVLCTCALRLADNASVFVEAAQEILRVPVEVITGDYEAELVYRGVAHHLGVDPVERLVIDIGGGSTEFGFGNGATPRATLSVVMGCVAYRDRFFAPGVPQAEGYVAAKNEALATLKQKLSIQDFVGDELLSADLQVFGTSGTLESIDSVLRVNGWSRSGVTPEGLRRLESAIVKDRWVVESGLPGLAPDRVYIFPAGVAILSACVETFRLKRCQFVDVSLMQGVIYEQFVGDGRADMREAGIEDLMTRYAVDRAQSERVVRCALTLFAQTSDWWQGSMRSEDLLRWAAMLHELGMYISPKHYHRHGAYVVKHAQLAGFSAAHQGVLALLIRGHRRSMPTLAFRAYDPAATQQLLRLVALLRLAVILERSHNDADSPPVSLRLKGDDLFLRCGEHWLERHPLSWRELEVEQDQQRLAGLQLHLEDAPEGGARADA